MPASPAKWLDSKDALLDVLMRGYADLGFGVQQQNVVPQDDQHPALSFQRAFNQAGVPRPLLTVMRRGGRTSPMFLGVSGLNAGGGGAGVLQGATTPAITPVVPLEETFRVRVESLDTTGGMPTADWLIELASAILLGYYETLTWPVEEGGYGLYNVTWEPGMEGSEPFTEISGKIIFYQTLDVSLTRFVSVPPPPFGPSIGGFSIDVSVAVGSGQAAEVGVLG